MVTLREQQDYDDVNPEFDVVSLLLQTPEWAMTDIIKAFRIAHPPENDGSGVDIESLLVDSR